MGMILDTVQLNNGVTVYAKRTLRSQHRQTVVARKYTNRTQAQAVATELNAVGYACAVYQSPASRVFFVRPL